MVGNDAVERNTSCYRNVTSIRLEVMRVQAISLSGLEVATQQLEVAANNVANVSTPRYEPKRVVATDVRTGGVQAQVELANPVAGGPTSAETTGEDSTRFDEFTLGNSVDIVHEMTTMLAAVSAYKANLSVLRRTDDTERALLDAFV